MSRIRRFSLFLCALVLSGASIAQDKILVPYPAGGLSDVTARIFANTLSQQGHPFIVENLGGATGTLAAQKFLSNPSGQIFQGSQNELILPVQMNASVKYKSEDFAPLQYITQTYIMLAVRKDLKANTLEEFLELAKANEKTPLSYGTVGVGSLYHLIGEYLAKRKNVKFNHVPYKGGAPSMQDLIGGQIDFTITPYSTTFDDMQAKGMFKMIGVFSKEKPSSMNRIGSVSDLPGLAGFEFSSFAGYFVKSDASAEQKKRYGDMLARALGDESLRSRLSADGRRVFTVQTSEAASRFYAAEIQRYKDLLKTVGSIDMK